MFGGYFGYAISAGMGMPLWAALIISLVAMAMLGILYNYVAYYPIENLEDKPTFSVVMRTPDDWTWVMNSDRLGDCKCNIWVTEEERTDAAGEEPGADRDEERARRSQCETPKSTETRSDQGNRHQYQPRNQQSSHRNHRQRRVPP